MDKTKILNDLKKHYGFEKTVEFAKFLGISSQSLANWYARESFDFEILYTKCVGVSGDWLLGDDCPMFRNIKNYSEANNELLILNDRKEKTLKSQVIPVYNMQAAAGLASLFNDSNSYTPVDYISLPRMGKVDGGLYAFGDSMYPLIKSGDIVVYRQIHNIHQNIFPGEMYILSFDIEGEEYIVIKYINQSELPDHIKLVSQNQYHAPKDIPLSSISAIAQIKASVRFNIMRSSI